MGRGGASTLWIPPQQANVYTPEQPFSPVASKWQMEAPSSGSNQYEKRLRNLSFKMTKVLRHELVSFKQKLVRAINPSSGIPVSSSYDKPNLVDFFLQGTYVAADEIVRRADFQGYTLDDVHQVQRALFRERLLKLFRPSDPSDSCLVPLSSLTGRNRTGGMHEPVQRRATVPDVLRLQRDASPSLRRRKPGHGARREVREIGARCERSKAAAAAAASAIRLPMHRRLRVHVR